jgi:hypothetical protein
MEKENRLYAFLVSKYGAREADKAMLNFTNQKLKYVQQGKK